MSSRRPRTTISPAETMRDGVRWHLIERAPYNYDFSSVERQIEAAEEVGAQIIWDVFHYGFPNDLDILSEEFINRFAAFARAFVEFLGRRNFPPPYLLCLINEISFFSWIAGDIGMWHPYLRGKGDELKRQLVRAHLRAAAEIKKISTPTILIQTDPAIRVLPSRGNPRFVAAAKNYHESQFAALDALLGVTHFESGGNENAIDIIGLNYYSNNQWRHPSGRRVNPGSKHYQPFRYVLADFYERYKKPLFVAETGIENEARSAWFRYVCEEVRAALEMQIPILGVCLYPIVNHPGWDDNRHCHNGLWDYPNHFGEREIFAPLAAEVVEQREIFARISDQSANIRNEIL